MKTWFSPRSAWLRRTLALSGMAVVLIVLVGLAFTGQARADGGGFVTPTPTSTNTPTPTETPTPTNTPEPTQEILPTLTSPVIGELVTGTAPSLIIGTPVPDEAQGGLGLVCWPFAIGLILLIIIIATVLIGGQTSYP